MDEEEVDCWIAGWDLGELGDEEGVAAYVDPIGWEGGG